jgi:carbonic anhydrase
VAALSAHAKDDPPPWSYQGKRGAHAWGELGPGYATCKLGKFQSPIDIRDADAQKAALPEIGFRYTPARGRVVNNGHTIQVNMTAAGGVTLADGDYDLVQFHFHAPSEEKFNGKRHPMDAHLVHRNARGALAVVAVQFEQGRANAALQKVFDRIPMKSGEKRVLPMLDATGLLPADRAYYRFKGSLTTPPCSEEVAWHVLRQPVEVSRAQLQAFRKLYPMNARPVQPLNGRTIEVN